MARHTSAGLTPASATSCPNESRHSRRDAPAKLNPCRSPTTHHNLETETAPMRRPGAIAPNGTGRCKTGSEARRADTSGGGEFCDASVVSAVGYARVSTDHQSLDSEQDEVGCTC